VRLGAGGWGGGGHLHLGEAKFDLDCCVYVDFRRQCELKIQGGAEALPSGILEFAHLHVARLVRLCAPVQVSWAFFKSSLIRFGS
jgi:hypothetical protein